MKFITVPVIFTVGFLMFEQRDKMMDLYHAAYPADPAKAEALNACAEDPNFNRLDSGDRAACYSGTYGRKPPTTLIATPQPTYPYNPSHLPANDIRREEANSSYLGEAPDSLHPPVLYLMQHPVLPPHRHPAPTQQ